MSRLTSAFDRLSKREKVLVGTMLGLVFGGTILVLQLWLGSGVAELEERVAEDRATLQQLYAKSEDYLKVMGHSERLKKLAEKNQDLNLKLAINELGKSISFEARSRTGAIEGTKRMSDVVQFEQTQETYLSKKPRAKNAKKTDVQAGYYRRDQQITIADTVPFGAIYQFLEKIESSDQLLFVSDVDMQREFHDGQIARKNAQITVSTLYYKGEDE